MLYCKCEKCAKEAIVDTSKMLLTVPPQFGYKCPECGYEGFTIAEVIYEKVKEEVKVPDIVQINTCELCGEEFESETERHICNNCKEVFVWLKQHYYKVVKG